MKLTDRIKRLSEFHGHLGPYLIIGLRMGDLSNEILGSEEGAGTGRFTKRVIVKTGIKPPISCIIDGIQFSSGCTLGKGNIEVVDQQNPEAIFVLNEKKLTVRLKESFKIAERDLEQTAMEIYNTPIQELFDITKNF